MDEMTFGWLVQYEQELKKPAIPTRKLQNSF